MRLGATVVFPIDFSANIETPVVESLPNQPPLNAVGGAETPLGQQKAYGWAFQADPKITISYTYA